MAKTKGIRFTKMHGLGNDFIVIDAIHQPVSLDKKAISHLAKRNTGIGFDQCLLVEASAREGVDFSYRIFNADGQEVGQCGNGARCLALFLRYYGLTDKNPVVVATSTISLQLLINEDNTVTVGMGKPFFAPEQIPFLTKSAAAPYSISAVAGNRLWHVVNVGNPHAIVQVEDVSRAPVNSLGQQISEHTSFPEQTNVGFMQKLSKNHIKLRVYERGCGETQACGSAAVAAAAIGRNFYDMSEIITVSLPGGDLRVSWPDRDSAITLTGPGVFVYEGELLS